MPATGIEPVLCHHNRILSPARLPVPPRRQNGWRWIRTTEAICSRFTVCPLWPLGNPSIFFLFDGTNRARTYDPQLVRQMLSQLSYDPIQTTQKRLELSTSAVTGRRSNQLSHWAIQNIKLLKWTFWDSNPGPTGYEPVALTN